MKLLEHEAKTLLARAGVAIPKSEVLKNSDTIPQLPFVLKSQVPTGGRGKAGGILVIKTTEEVQPAIDTLLQLPIKGFTPTTLLAEQFITIKKELYLSLAVDRASMSIQLMAHVNGGIEVEDNHDFFTLQLPDEPDFDVIGQALADYYNLPGQTFALQDLAQNLYKCFTANDATLLEINPLILTKEDTLVAGDCKMTLDDAAAFRHEWNFEDTPVEANFVTIDPSGNTATIANGAGLAMATVDAAYDAGLHPANFLDIGGGANTETLLAAFEKIVEYPELKIIIINIFAGITRSDEVAKAIIAAREQIEALPPLFIRIAGTNYEQAATLLSDANIAILPDLESCLEAAKEAINA